MTQKNIFLEEGNLRNYALVVVGLNSALRVSDILSLVWADVYNFDERSFKSHILITEKKTGKDKKLLLNKPAINALQRLKKEEGNI